MQMRGYSSKKIMCQLFSLPRENFKLMCITFDLDVVLYLATVVLQQRLRYSDCSRDKY